MAEKTITLQMSAGTSAVFTIPVNLDEGKGFFPRKDKIKLSNSTDERTLLNGFVVETKSVGTISAEGVEGLAVKYSHKEPTENKIYFFALTGEKATIYIINTPIHDHSSIVQGGPAVGTYFVDEG